MNRETLTVHVGTASPYDVFVGEGSLAFLGERLRETTGARRAALVTDTTVAGLWADAVEASLAGAGVEVVRIVVPPGETSKSWARAGEVLETLASVPLSRKDAVVALGGGVVGDLAGFCAATYMRGIPYVQVPTTLLAQVDSSVGGKTGVDLVHGKNLAGAFLQPACVVADVATLATLSAAQRVSGLGEVAKTALLAGEEQTAEIETDAAALAEGESSATAGAVFACVRHKASVVSLDEREAGPRESLNYGHTLGHAIEVVTGYGTVPHGLAVAEGMRFAATLAVRFGESDSRLVARQASLLDALGLTRTALSADPGNLLEAMRADKKVRGEAVRFVVLRAPGSWTVVEPPEALLREVLASWSTGQGEKTGVDLT
ncbi:MAG: 3-dehydroquinate synthase [Coriobacteriia bacterium]